MAKVPKEKLKEVKEMIANTALSQLQKGEDFSELANTQVEFGYVFENDQHYEALFKVITDKNTAYFAAQGGKLMRLNFTEDLFLTTTEQTISRHGDWQ